MRRLLPLTIILILALTTPAVSQAAEQPMPTTEAGQTAKQNNTSQTAKQKEEKKSNPLLKKAPFILGGLVILLLLYQKIVKPALRRARKGSQGPNFRVRNDRRLQELAEQEMAQEERSVAAPAEETPAPVMPPQQTNQIAPGWYPDPSDDSLVRWWDGQSWTDQSQARPQ